MAIFRVRRQEVPSRKSAVLTDPGRELIPTGSWQQGPLSVNGCAGAAASPRSALTDSDVSHSLWKNSSGAAVPAASRASRVRASRSFGSFSRGREPEANTHSPGRDAAAEKNSQRHRTRLPWFTLTAHSEGEASESDSALAPERWEQPQRWPRTAFGTSRSKSDYGDFQSSAAGGPIT